ncbi:30S ribosomal protein S2 [Patescibacteria group bacterium]
MKNTEDKITEDKVIEQMFEAGAHFGYSRAKRHSSAKRVLFGSKNGTDIFDLEKTKKYLEEAKEFVKSLSEQKKQILFVGGKNEARKIVEETAVALGLPFVASRWIGGTLTNFTEIRKRVQKLERLRQEKEKGEWGKYTKKEALDLSKELEKLEKTFSGLVEMKSLPTALFVVDAKHEDIAVTEAKSMNIPVVSLSNSDNDISKIDYPIPANDTSKTSIEYFVKQIEEAYK